MLSLFRPKKSASETPQAELALARQQASEYAMAFDLLAMVSQSDSENEVIQQILYLFETLFSPGRMIYASLVNGKPDMLHSISPLTETHDAVKERMERQHKGTLDTLPDGFFLKITYQGKAVGLVEIDEIAFPEHRGHYLNLALAIVEVCGLAIENAKRLEQLKKREAQLRSEKEKLEKALGEVKTLSGLLPICMHCKSIRDDEGYWSKIEEYIHHHADVTFSHGICKACAKKYYPDMDLYGDEDDNA